MKRALLALTLLGLSPLRAEAAGLMVLPLDAVGTELFEVARASTRVMLATLRDIPGVSVMETHTASQELGINIAEQVQSCRRDTLCLVQIGEAVSAEQIFLGEIADKPGGPRELKLYVVDVAKAQMVNTLSWRMPAEQAALDDAVSAAVKQLFMRADARVVFEVMPKDASLYVYDELSDLKLWQEVAYWSGVYYMRVEAKGFEPRNVRVTLPRGGPTRVVIELEQDPLWFDPTSKTKPTSKPRPGKFAVVPIDAESSVTPERSRGALGPSAFANWVAWSIVGVGAAASVTGGLVMMGAQSDYNALSVEPRFIVGTTTPAGEAIVDRDDARSRFSLGSTVMLTGIGVAAGGLLWMMIDAASGSKAPVALAPTAGGGVSCALSF